jgi:hypothetical protein
MAKSAEQIVSDWVAYARYHSPAEEAPEQVQADAMDLGWLVEDEPEKAWEAIRQVIARYPEADLMAPERTEAQRVVGLLAAGPLEDFLALHGPDYIERVEDEAKRDPRMVWALGGAWKFTMTDDVWARVQRAALTTVYMPLLGEGVDVWRPVEATALGGSHYRVRTAMPEGEHWAFPPPKFVRCERRTFSGGKEGMAVVGFVD